MRKLSLTALIIVVFLFHVNAQKEMWSQPVHKDTYMTQLETGQILIKEKGTLTLLDNTSGKVIWKNNVETDKDPIFLDGLPIMYFEGKSYAIIDGPSGKIIDKSSEKTEVLKIHYFWEENRVLIEQNRDNSLYLTNVDFKKLDASWSTRIAEIKKTFFGLVANSTKNNPSISNDGSTILIDNKAVTTVSKDGKIKERIDFKENLEKIGFNSYNNYLYVREEKKLHFINTETGKIEKSQKIEEDDFSFNILDGGKIISLRDGKNLTYMDSKNGEVIVDKKFDDKIKDSYFDEKSNKFYMVTKKSVIEVNQKDGKIVREAELGNNLRKFYTCEDKLFIDNGYQPNEISLENLKLKYPKPLNIPAIEDYIEYGDKTLYVNTINNNCSLHMISQEGKEIWSSNIPSNVVPSVDNTPAGILVITNIKLHLLDINTGKSKLKSGFETGPSFAYHIDETKNILTTYSDKRVKILNLNTGEVMVSKEEVEFKDFDYTQMKPQLNVTEDRIYLKGSNSIFLLDKTANIIHSKHYKRTNNTSTIIGLVSLVATATAIGTGNGEKVLNIYDGNNNEVYRGDYVDGLNSLNNMSESLAEKRRREQNRGSSAYPYVYTKLENEKNKGLIFLDKKTGSHKYEVEMNEKEPNYIVDEIDGVLFYLNEGKLTAFEL